MQLNCTQPLQVHHAVLRYAFVMSRKIQESSLKMTIADVLLINQLAKSHTDICLIDEHSYKPQPADRSLWHEFEDLLFTVTQLDNSKPHKSVKEIMVYQSSNIYFIIIYFDWDLMTFVLQSVKKPNNLCTQFLSHAGIQSHVMLHLQNQRMHILTVFIPN